MISARQYFMGRDVTYKNILTIELRENATIMVGRANKLLEHATAGGVYVNVNPATGSIVSSGWRPPEINAGTPNAAAKSKHMTCQAVDIYDPEGELDEWCMANTSVLESVMLWMEHPSATKGWTHFQTVPPRSGNRVFYP